MIVSKLLVSFNTQVGRVKGARAVSLYHVPYRYHPSDPDESVHKVYLSPGDKPVGAVEIVWQEVVRGRGSVWDPPTGTKIPVCQYV